MASKTSSGWSMSNPKTSTPKNAPTAIQSANLARATAKAAWTYTAPSAWNKMTLSQATAAGQASWSMSFNPSSTGGAWYVSFGSAWATPWTVTSPTGTVTTTYAPKPTATPPPPTSPAPEWVSGESPAPSPGATEAVQGEATAPSGPGTPQDLSWIVTPSWQVWDGKTTTTPSTKWAWSTAKNNQQQSWGWYVAFNAGQMQNIAATQEKLAQQWVSQAEQVAKLSAMFWGWSNEVFNQRYAAGKAIQAQQQEAANAIKETTTPITRESDDSPYWNKFGYTAVDQEKKHAGFINDRNTVVANSVVSKNTNIKYMTEAERAKLITDEIINRQGSAIDKNIQSRYDNTVASINWLIGRNVPVLKPEDYFTMLLNGEDTTWVPTTNPYYQAGKRRYDTLNSYINIGEAGITNAVQNKTLLPGTTAWNDLITKGFGAVLTQAQSTISSGSTVIDGLLSSIMSFDPNASLASQATIAPLFEWLEGQISLAMINTMLSDQVPTFAQFLLKDQEVQNARNIANATVAQINTLNQQVADLGDSMKEMFVSGGWTNENSAFMTAYIMEKSKPMIRQLDQLNAQYTNQAAMLTNATENARTQFEANQANKATKLSVYQFLLDRINAKSANEAAALQQKFDNEIKLATLNKPVVVGSNSRLVDPTTGKVIYAGSGWWSGSGGGTGTSGLNSIAKFVTRAQKNNTIDLTQTKTNLNDSNMAAQWLLSVFNNTPESGRRQVIKDAANVLGKTPEQIAVLMWLKNKWYRVNDNAVE